MFINEVETKVGLSKKAIRYYEKMGLLIPKRSNSNDYREYTDEDINTLQKIKFLRELNIPIQDIKKIKDNNLNLKEYMEDLISKIEYREHNLSIIKYMCNEISITNSNYNNFDIDKYSKYLNILNKEGFTMKNTKHNHTAKIMGAVISSIIFITILSAILCTIIYFQITETEKAPIVIFILIIGFLLVPIVSIIINLINRINEIKGGEEDEASKY